MYRLLFVILFALVTAVANAQTPLSTTSKKAEKLYEESKQFLRARNFDKCIEYLKKAIDIDPSFMEAHFALANAYNTLRQPDDAERHFRKCLELKPNDPRNAPVYYQVGVLDFQRGDYASATRLLERYVATNPANASQMADARRKIAAASYAAEAMKNPVPFKPSSVGEVINALQLQYFPVLSGDQQTMIFTARISNSPRHDENMYQSVRKNDVWTAPELIAELNTPYNEGTCTISADGKVMIFTVCEGTGDRQVLGSCDLFISYKKGNRWGAPQNMGPEVNSRAWDTQPSLSADGRTLYFVSDRKEAGHVGGYDIWKSVRNDKGDWSKAVNLGPSVNTPNNELAPFIHANGQSLFFASDGHPGMGGYDLFVSDRAGSGWQKPRNLGYPVNDHRNQMGLFITADGQKGYYSHEETKGTSIVASHIYEFDVPESFGLSVSSNYVKGTVYDAKTKQKLGSRIDLIDLGSDSVVSTAEADPITGEYLIMLNKGADYALYVNREGYLFQSLSFNFSASEGRDVEIDIPLNKADKGSSIVLNNIFFETAKWDLVSKSRTELNRLLTFMQQNKNIKVEIGGHTDDIGSEQANLELSRKRAQSVVEYLTKAGISPERLIAKGYGKSQPKVPNTSDENRAQNRRIEFLIL